MADLRALTVRQPWADLIISGQKPVENRSWPVPSTLPQWWRCEACGRRAGPGEDESSYGDLYHRCQLGGDHAHPKLDGPFPFRLMIHAGQRIDWPATHTDLVHTAENVQALAGLPWYRDGQDGVLVGELLGTVEVTGCHHADECRYLTDDPATSPLIGEPLVARYCSRWAEPDRWHWTLADPQPLDEPVPMRGRQGLWRLPEAVTDRA